jgi:DNA-binding MarR family transcriptional regulator
MERRGWLTRRPDPTDGRYTLASLTDAGMAKLEVSAPGHVTAVRHLVFDGLSPAQVRQVAQIARRIVQAAGKRAQAQCERATQGCGGLRFSTA